MVSCCRDLSCIGRHVRTLARFKSAEIEGRVGSVVIDGSVAILLLERTPADLETGPVGGGKG